MPNKLKSYHPDITNTGWDRDMDVGQRRMLMLKTHGGDNLASARAMQALSNITQDRKTREEAAIDAKYFLKQHLKGKTAYPITRHIPRITPRTPRLR